MKSGWKAREARLAPHANDLYFILGLAAAAIATYAVGLRKIPALLGVACLFAIIAVTLRALGVRI